MYVLVPRGVADNSLRLSRRTNIRRDRWCIDRLRLLREANFRGCSTAVRLENRLGRTFAGRGAREAY